MNEAIKTKLLEQFSNVAEITKEGVMKAVEVVQEQCPMLVEELLRWEFAISLINCLCGVGVLCGYHLYRKPWWKEVKEDSFNDPDVFTPFFIASFVHNIFGFLLVALNLTWLKIWIAPRLFLLEYISDLIK
jgi:hypothetical protein